MVIAAKICGLKPFSKWTQLLLCCLFVLYSCAQSTQPAQPTEMNLDQAILLTKAWCEEARERFDQAKISSNGDFRGVFGAPEIVYSAQEKKLSVEGLVIHDATLQVEYPEYFDKIRSVGEREPYTMGEGYFFIEKTPLNEKTPQLTLRKDFVDGSIKAKQFVLEVNWLMNWSTYWRLQRSHTISGVSEEDLIKEAPGIEAKFRKSSPRPW
ncbi:MAG: hypothetical protein H7Z72_13035 [Bacteroidetes bacterium]|nr:hypothetical protein [Fibrella sp.]